MVQTVLSSTKNWDKRRMGAFKNRASVFGKKHPVVIRLFGSTVAEWHWLLALLPYRMGIAVREDRVVLHFC